MHQRPGACLQADALALLSAAAVLACVRVWSRPNGLPTANTAWPTRSPLLLPSMTGRSASWRGCGVQRAAGQGMEHASEVPLQRRC